MSIGATAVTEAKPSEKDKLAYRLVLIPAYGSCFLEGNMLSRGDWELDIKLRLLYGRPIKIGDDNWRRELTDACNVEGYTIYARGIVKAFPDKVELFDQFTGELLLRVSKLGSLDIKTSPQSRVPVQTSCKCKCAPPPAPTPGFREKATAYFQTLSWGSVVSALKLG